MSRYENWSKSKLIRIRTPQFQRPLIQKSIRDIYLHIATRLEQGQDLLFGVISVAEIRTRFGISHYIIDGQHRLNALKLFMDDHKLDIPQHVMIYECEEFEMKNIFDVVNRNVMQSMYVISEDSKKDLLGEIQSYLSDEMGKIFVNKQTKRPYIYLPTFMDKLSESEWFSDIFTFEEFREKLLDQNSRLELLLNNTQYCTKNKISHGMIRQWSETGIYLGVDSNFLWLN
jgi:hypothetical protein